MYVWVHWVVSSKCAGAALALTAAGHQEQLQPGSSQPGRSVLQQLLA